MHTADRQFILTSIIVGCTLIVLVLAGIARSDDFYVDVANGSDTTGDGSAANPWQTITHALDVIKSASVAEGTAANPHTIYVAPGTYTYRAGGASPSESFPLSWTELPGDDHPANYTSLVGSGADTTIIDYGYWDSSGEDKLGLVEVDAAPGHRLYGIEFRDVTFQNGHSEYSAGAMFCRRCEVTVSSCIFQDNVTDIPYYADGGAIYVEDSDFEIYSTVIDNNSAEQGGGIFAKDCEPHIHHCTIENNDALSLGGDGIGGGIMLDSCSYFLIEHNQIVHNHADVDGGGIAVVNCPGGDIGEDNSIRDNDADNNGGGIYLKGSSPNIFSNMIRAGDTYGGPGNTATNGAGIYMTGFKAATGGWVYSDPHIYDWNEIAENYAELSGGGIYINYGCAPLIEGNEFFFNKARNANGAALYSYRSNATIQGNYIGWNECPDEDGDQEGHGAGIFCEDGTYPPGENTSSSAVEIDEINWIHSNTCTDGNGGGVYLLNASSDSLLENNNIWNNYAVLGDGIFLEAPQGIVIRDNGIRKNHGQGVYVNGSSSNSSATLFNNLIFARETNPVQDTGVYFQGPGTLRLKSLTIADHPVRGVYVSGEADTSLYILNTIIWGNGTSIETSGTPSVTVRYSDVEGGWSGTGNFDQDPLFIAGPSSSHACGAYFLKQNPPQSGDESPCKNAGDDFATTYFTDEYSTRTDAEPDTGMVDVGFHYGHESATYIDLVSFEAKGLDGKVLLSWKTGAEIETAGFYLYRRQKGQDHFIKVNDGIIASKGSASAGASYLYSDSNVVNGTTYIYYLVDIDLAGRATAHGPVVATPRARIAPVQRPADLKKVSGSSVLSTKDGGVYGLIK